MDEQNSRTECDLSQPDRTVGLLLRRAEQVVIAVCLLFGFVAMAGYFVQRGGMCGRFIEIEHAEPVDISFRIDINVAGWPELTLLPNIGETLARRIVAHRDQHGPFVQIEQLLDVDGIGPKTLEQLRPYVLPLPRTESLAESTGADSDL